MKPKCIHSGLKYRLCECDECKVLNLCEMDEASQLRAEEAFEKEEKRARDLDNPARYDKY